MSGKGAVLKELEKRGKQYYYRNKWWTPNTPVRSNAKGKKMMVFATKIVDGKRRGKIIHFGAVGYGHNYSKKAKQNYLTRSAGIRNKEGKLTKNDKWSPNYWARKVLWPKEKKATGPKKTTVSSWKQAA